MAETFFYVTGSIFFTLSVLILLVVLIFSVVILRKAVSIETEIKNTVAEARNKITSFSVGVAGLVAILEKLVKMREEWNQKDGGDEKPADKGKRPKKIFVRE